RFLRRIDALRRRGWLPGFEMLVYAPHVFHFVVMLALTFLVPKLAVPKLGPAGFAPLIGLIGLFTSLFLAIHQALFSVVNLGFGVAAVWMLFRSYVHARAPRLRQQLRVIAIGLSAGLLLYSWAALIPTLFNFQIPGWQRSALTAGALTLGSGAIAYAIVRHKFLD